MFRKSTLMLAVAVLAVFAFTAMAMAQTYSGSSPKTSSSAPGKSITSSATPAQHSSKSATSHRKDAWFTTMQNLYQEDEALYDQWNTLNDRYTKIMSITDPNQLKTELAAYQQMVNDYNTRISSYQNMWKTDMAQYEPKTSKTAMTGVKTTTHRKTAKPESK